MTLPESSIIKTYRYEREHKKEQEENNKETITLSQWKKPTWEWKEIIITLNKTGQKQNKNLEGTLMKENKTTLIFTTTKRRKTLNQLNNN